MNVYLKQYFCKIITSLLPLRYLSVLEYYFLHPCKKKLLMEMRQKHRWKSKGLRSLNTTKIKQNIRGYCTLNKRKIIPILHV